MRGVVAVYARKVRFLYEDCMKTLSRLNALSRAHRADRNLLEKPEGGRDARATMTMAYDGDILARPEFERVHVSQAYDSQAFHMVASEQLEDAFDVAGDATGDRFTVRDDDRINLLELQMPVDEAQAAMDEQYEYEFAMRGDDGRRISIQEEDEEYMDYQIARADDTLEEALPLAVEDEEPLEQEPIGTQLKRMREREAEAERMMTLPEPKAKKRRTAAMARTRVFVFDNQTHLGSDVFRAWLSSTRDIVQQRPDEDTAEAVIEGKEAERDFLFHSEAFKVNPSICARSALELFVVNPNARFAFEQFIGEEPVMYESDEERDRYHDVMYDEHGNVRSTEKMRAVLSAKKSTPGSGFTTGFFNREKITPSTFHKSGRSSGLGFDSGSKLAGMFIPEDPDEDLPIPDNYDHILGSEIDFGEQPRAGSHRRRTTTTTPSQQPSLLETDDQDMFAHATPHEIGKASLNLLQFLSRAVFTTEKPDTEMESVSVTDLCVRNHLSRAKAARLFYQTLVLVAADYLTAYQDASEAFGEITLVPGPRFEFTADAA